MKNTRDMARALPTIVELLASFSDNSNEEYLYRGHSRNFPTLLPSAYRGFAEPAPDDPGGFVIPRSRVIAQRTRRQEEQARLRSHWIQQFGLSLGNLLAQQYLVQSEVIDVTTNPLVAAFFATRRGASYAHIDHADEPGVLLRWKRQEGGDSLTELRQELGLGMLSILHASPSAPPIPVKYTPVAPGTEEYKLVRDEPNAWLLLRPAIFTPSELRRVLAAAVEKERGSIYPRHWMFEYFAASRWAKQSGSMIRPTMRFPARATLDGDKFHRALDADFGLELVTNLKVVIGMPDLVADVHAGIPSERFEFRHTSHPIDLTPEELFPSPSIDLMFLVAATLAWTTHTDYFDEARANFPWEPHCGIVDRGYYPAVVNEDYLRSEWELFTGLLRQPPPGMRSPAGFFNAPG